MENKDKKIRGAYASLTGFKRAVPIILFAIALFTGLCFITPNNVGLGMYVGDFFRGLFSVGGYFIPFFLAIHAVFYPSDVIKKRVLSRVVFTVVTLLAFSSLLHTIKSFSVDMTFNPAEFYEAGKVHSGGGFFGGIIGYALMKIFGPVGLIIVAALIFALYITYFFANGKSTLAKILLAVLNKISNIASTIDKKRKANKAKNETKRAEAKAPKLSEKHSDLYDDEFFSVNNGLSELKIEELGINEKRDPRDLELFPHLQEKVLHNPSDENDDIFGKNADEFESASETSSDIIIENEEENSNFKYADTDSADSVFTKEFDPFDFAMNANLAEKQTRKAREASESINEYAEPVRTFSEKDIEDARRRADFEMKKKALLEAEERRKAMEEESRKQEKIRELLREEPPEQKATYTRYDSYAAASNQPETFTKNVSDFDEQDRANEDKYQRAASFVSAINGYNEELTSKKQQAERAQSAYGFAMKNETERAPFSEESSCKTAEQPSKESFQSYTVPSPDEYMASDEKEENTLKLGRTILDPTPIFEEEKTEEPADEEEEEEGFELGFGEQDGDGESLFSEIIPEEERNPDVAAYRNMFSVFSEEEKARPEALIVTEEEPLKPIQEEIEEKIPDDILADDSSIPFEASTPQAAEKPKEAKPKGPDYSNYKAPPIDLLKKGAVETDENINEEITKNGEKLIDTLAQFNVRASIRSVDIGPRITRYEIVPAKGVRVNSVINLFDDISLNLAAEGIRMEAPIPGKSAIGVEIPNKKPQMVFLRDLLETDEFKSAESTTMACFGKDVTGNPVLGDIAKMPHMLIAGATGMGKSVCINSIMISMLYRSRPDELKFIMIDPKMVEFNGYNGIPHLLIPVIIDVKQAAGALMWAVEQMEKRYEMFLQYSVRNLDGYNQKMRENPALGAPLSKIVIVIDELNDLMLQARKPVEDLIMRIAQKARAAGIHLIIGTQRPSVDVITGVIKANIPSRIACKVASFTDSKTILEQAGAEKLLNNGDMLFWPVGKPKPTRVQGAFVSDGEVEKVMNFLKTQNKGSGYDEQALEEINRAAQKCVKGGKGDDMNDDDDSEAGAGYFNDPQFLEAVELAVKQGKIATSLIQRKIGVGYGKAAKFIDIMEEQGFVSEPNGQKPRDVLITKDEWHEILSRRSLD